MSEDYKARTESVRTLPENVALLASTLYTHVALMTLYHQTSGVRRLLSSGVCAGLLWLLLRVTFTTAWATPGPNQVGEGAVIRLGEHFFSDYLLPFELASVLLLMAMIGAIVLARRDVLATDVATGEVADQGLIEKARTPLLLERRSSP